MKRLRDFGIEPLTVSFELEHEQNSFNSASITKDLDRVIKACKEQNIYRATVWASSVISTFFENPSSEGKYDLMMKEIEAMNEVIPKLSDEGIKFTYHNHYQEFTTYHRGVSVFDQMLIHADPRLEFVFDAGWALVAGHDPVQIMQRIEGRIWGVHLKDISDIEACKKFDLADESNPMGFTGLGSGLLDVCAVSKEAERQKITWGIVEQDRLRNLNEMDSLTMARLCMRESGSYT